MSKRALLILLCWLVSMAPAFGQEGEPETDPLTQDEKQAEAQRNQIEARLQEAWYLEVASGRYEEALKVYQQLLAQAGLDPVLRARTQLRLAITLRRLGRIEESRTVLQELLARHQVEAEAMPAMKEKRVEVLLAIRAAERQIEDMREYLTEDHPKYQRTLEELRELRGRLSDLTSLTEAQRRKMQPILEAAQDELTGEDSERSSLRRKVESLIAQLDGSEETSNRVRGALRDIGPAAAPLLIEALQSGGYYATQTAARLLADFAEEDPSLLPLLKSAIRSGDPVVQKALREGLYRDSRNRKRSWSAEVVRSFLTDESPEVRRVGISLWGASEDAQRFPEALLGLADDPSAEVRAGAIGLMVLYAEKFPELRGALEKVAQDDSPNVHRSFLQAAAGRSHVETFAPQAIDLLGSEDPTVASAAMEALLRWAGSRRGGPLLEDPALQARLVEALERILETGSVEQRRQALHTLSISPSDRARDLQLRGLEDPVPSVARAAVSALDDHLDVPRVAARFVDLMDHEILGANIRGALARRTTRPVVRSFLFERLNELSDELLRELFDVKRGGPSEELASLIASPEPLGGLSTRVQRHLIRTIANHRLEIGVPVVKRALQSADQQIVELALGAADRIPSRDFIEPLEALLKSTEPEILNAALDAAQSLGAVELIEPIGALVDHEDPAVRREALSVLGGMEHPAVLPFAVDGMTDPEERVAEEAAQTAYRQVRRADPRPWIDRIIERLHALHPEAWSEFSWIIRESGTAGDALGLAQKLSGAPAWMQEGILELLAFLKNPDVLPPVRSMLESNDADVRRQAQRVLLEIGEFEDIVGLLHGEFSSLAIRALGRTADDRAFPILLEQLENSSGGNAAIMVEALESFARPAAVPVLVGNATSNRAAWVTHKEETPEGERKWRELASVRTLAKYPPEAALAGLEKILASSVESDARLEAIDTLTRFSEPRARELIIGQIESDLPSVRAAAIDALGTFLDEDLLPRLVELLRHRLPEVREAAQRSIEKIRFYLDQKEFAERVLSGGEPSGELQELMKMLASDQASVRLAAAEALGRIGDERALPALAKARKDPDERVRAAVEAAIDSIVE